MEEVPTRIEPCFFEDSIPQVLSDLVRIMNCYYSNLIEGHNTRPKDIAKALTGAELEDATRPLALEAKAHVVVQREIDQMHHEESLPIPTSVDFISWVHQRFYNQVPDEFKFVERHDDTKISIKPGV